MDLVLLKLTEIDDLKKWIQASNSRNMAKLAKLLRESQVKERNQRIRDIEHLQRQISKQAKDRSMPPIRQRKVHSDKNNAKMNSVKNSSSSNLPSSDLNDREYEIQSVLNPRAQKYQKAKPQIIGSLPQNNEGF